MLFDFFSFFVFLSLFSKKKKVWFLIFWMPSIKNWDIEGKGVWFSSSYLIQLFDINSFWNLAHHLVNYNLYDLPLLSYKKQVTLLHYSYWWKPNTCYFLLVLIFLYSIHQCLLDAASCVATYNHHQL